MDGEDNTRQFQIFSNRMWENILYEYETTIMRVNKGNSRGEYCDSHNNSITTECVKIVNR